YDDANHHPIVGVNGDISKNAVQINVKPGERISLDASDSVDPDGDSLTFEWIYYSEPSTYKGNVVLSGNGPEMTFVVPEDAGGLTMHVILRVTDDGTPALSSYRRFVFVAGEQ
ncbi:MAG: hypothetical protein K2K37_00815, partial [Muribaculaceae bacterium]|nr:hypothetical protein [Muribaculaceae bacterium]